MALYLCSPGTALEACARSIAWLCVYGAHGALWAAACVVLCRLAVQRAATRHALWRLALLGPLLTTWLSALPPLATALGDRGSLVLLSALPSADGDAPALARAPQARAARLCWTLDDDLSSRLIPALLALALAAGLVRFTASLQALRRVLHGRTTVSDARLNACFRVLLARSHIRRAHLSESAHARSPLVVGVHEICLPLGLISQLSNQEVDAVLAHELAHLERRDGLWFMAIGLVESVLWMQPLNRWLGARYRESAELACDDRAVELTGAPHHLARALIRVAELTQAASAPHLLPAILPGAGLQLQRVQRLLIRPSGPVPRSSWAPLACFLTLGVAAPSLRADLRAVSVPQASFHSTLDAQTDVDDARELEIEALAQRAWELEQALAHPALGASASSERESLEQELRHARAMQASLRERLDPSPPAAR